MSLRNVAFGVLVVLLAFSAGGATGVVLSESARCARDGGSIMLLRRYGSFCVDREGQILWP